MYEVHTDSGVCTCKSGQHGTFCKHQALIVQYFQVSMPSGPPLTSYDRHDLAKIALGEKCPQRAFFLGRTETFEDNDAQIDGECRFFQPIFYCRFIYYFFYKENLRCKIFL
jgi:hypothetical protein